MARGGGRLLGLALLALLAVVAGLAWWHFLSPEDSENTAPQSPDPAQVSTVAEEPERSAFNKVVGYPLRLRHKASAESERFKLEGVVQGENQWGLQLGESTLKGISPLAVMQKLNGNPATYAVTYDTEKTNFKPRLAHGVKRVRFSAAGPVGRDGIDPKDADWSFQVSGLKGSHMSATVDAGEVVYDGAFTHEQPIMEGLSALYAVDMKRRAGGENMAPGWFRHGLGLKYVSKIGDFKMNVYQPSPDGSKEDVELEAIYSGNLAGQPGSPDYSLMASRAVGGSLAYEGRMRVQGPKGVTGGLVVGGRDGNTSVGGFTDLSTKREVYPGVELSASTRVRATPGAPPELMPINFQATADLASLVPEVMTYGSELAAIARYKLGEEKPTLSATAVLRPRPVGPLNFNAEGRVTEHDVSGKVAASARVANVDATYSASKVVGRDVHHVGQAVWPAEPQADKDGVATRLFGRVTQSDMDYDGKPRLQVGMMYDFDAQGTKFSGSSNFFDMGDTLLNRLGKPKRPIVYNQAKNTAKVLRTRVNGGTAEGHRWLRKRQNFGD